MKYSYAIDVDGTLRNGLRFSHHVKCDIPEGAEPPEVEVHMDILDFVGKIRASFEANKTDGTTFVPSFNETQYSGDDIFSMRVVAVRKLNGSCDPFESYEVFS